MKKKLSQSHKLSKKTSDPEVDIRYSKQAEKFFLHNHRFSREETRIMVVQAVRYLMKIEQVNIDIKPLQGEFAGMYRLRKGNIRIIFSYEQGEIVIASVETVDFRGNVY